MYIHTIGVVAWPEFVRRALSGSIGPACIKKIKKRAR